MLNPYATIVHLQKKRKKCSLIYNIFFLENILWNVNISTKLIYLENMLITFP